MNAMTEHFSTVMLSGKGNAEQWKEMSVLNANGVETNKVSLNAKPTNNYSKGCLIGFFLLNPSVMSLLRLKLQS